MQFSPHSRGGAKILTGRGMSEAAGGVADQEKRSFSIWLILSILA